MYLSFFHYCYFIWFKDQYQELILEYLDVLEQPRCPPLPVFLFAFSMHFYPWKWHLSTMNLRFWQSFGSLLRKYQCRLHALHCHKLCPQGSVGQIVESLTYKREFLVNLLQSSSQNQYGTRASYRETNA